MMRYLSARIVPGVNPPAGIESEEIILATWGVSAGALTGSAAVPSAVGICEGVLKDCPHEEQNRLSGKFCAEHFGHCTIDGEAIGIKENDADYMRWIQAKEEYSLKNMRYNRLLN